MKYISYNIITCVLFKLTKVKTSGASFEKIKRRLISDPDSGLCL